HQCRRTAKQNSKQIQRNRSEDYISTEHKPQPGHETLPRARVPLVSFLRAAADENNQKEERKRAECIQQIHEPKPDVCDEKPAQSRTDDRSDLKNAVVPGDGVRECVTWNQSRKK